MKIIDAEKVKLGEMAVKIFDVYLPIGQHLRAEEISGMEEEIQASVLSSARTIDEDVIAEKLWEVSRNQAHLSMMVKPWEKTKQEVKDFYIKQARAIMLYLKGEDEESK